MAIIFAQEEAHSPLAATRSKAQEIRSFTPVGGAVFFIVIFPSRRELTRFISYLPKRRDFRRIAATWDSRSMADRPPTWMWWTMPAGVTFQTRKDFQMSRPRTTEPIILTFLILRALLMRM